MAERAAHIVDEVLPRVPVRQRVLSLPHRLRYLLAWDHRLCRAVLGVFIRALLDFSNRSPRCRAPARVPSPEKPLRSPARRAPNSVLDSAFIRAV